MSTAYEGKAHIIFNRIRGYKIKTYRNVEAATTRSYQDSFPIVIGFPLLYCFCQSIHNCKFHQTPHITALLD